MAVRLFATGGTIDCERYDDVSGQYFFKDTHLPQMLQQARNASGVEVEVLMLKDSALMSDSDRELILKKCLSCREGRILIAHGTDTMEKTAQFLGKNVKGKTIVLFGAIVPYYRDPSEAMFNLGFALAAVQLLPSGVYVAMDGKVFSGDNVRKNVKTGFFEKIQEE